MAKTIGVGGFNVFAFNEKEFNAKPEVTIEWVQQQVFIPQTRQLYPSQMAAMSGSGVFHTEPETGWIVQHPGPRLTTPALNPASISFKSTFPLFPIIQEAFTLISVVGSFDTAFILEGMAAIISGLVGSYDRQPSVVAENKVSLDAVGSEAVQLSVEGEYTVSVRTVTASVNRTFKVTGEYQPKRSVKGGFDG